jgi:hypothetical protein
MTDKDTQSMKLGQAFEVDLQYLLWRQHPNQNPHCMNSREKKTKARVSILTDNCRGLEPQLETTEQKKCQNERDTINYLIFKYTTNLCQNTSQKAVTGLPTLPIWITKFSHFSVTHSINKLLGNTSIISYQCVGGELWPTLPVPGGPAKEQHRYMSRTLIFSHNQCQ